MTLLHVDSSILGPYSVNRQLSAEIVAKLRQNSPDLEIKYRDLAAEPVPPLSGAYLAAQQPGAPAPGAEVQHIPPSAASFLMNSSAPTSW